MLLAAALLATACGGGSSTTASHTRRTAAHRTRQRTAPAPPARLVYRSLYALPAPLRDPAYTTLADGRFVMIGGLDAADVSTSEIDVADLSGVHQAATLPLAQHDAQAATLGGKAYVFGGGSATELDHILSYDPATNALAQVGALSAPQSDVAVAQAGGAAYVVGGYDGTNYLNTIVEWRPGSPPTAVAHLPVGLRYAAVAVAGSGLLVIGGSTPSAASKAIYRFDLTTHAVRQIGTLRHPITHGNAATLGSTVYLIGGRGDLLNAQTGAIWAINPVTGQVTSAGRLPTPTSDAAVAAIGNGIVVAGGTSPTTVLDGVGELVPAG
jgi:hypothetical protein